MKNDRNNHQIMHYFATAALLLAAVLSASASAEAQDAPPPPPSTESSAIPELESSDALIEEFGLPKVTDGPKMTLAEVLKSADENNISLAVMRTNIESAQATLKSAWGGVLPLIQGKISYMVHDHEDSVNFGDSFAPMLQAMGVTNAPPTEDTVIMQQQEAKGSLEASMPIVNFQSWVRIHVAEDAVNLSKLSVEAVRQQLLLNAAEAYFAAMMARKLIDLHLTTLASFVHHLSVAEARFEAGAGLRIDVIRAQTDVETAKQQIISANLFFDNARDALSILTGTKGLPMPVDEPSIAVPQEDNKKLEEEALSSRADIKVSRATISLNRRSLRESWAQFLPTIDAVWQGSYQFTDTGDMGSSDKSRMSAIFTLTVPIYNHYRYGDLDAKRAAIRKSELEQEELTTNISLSVRQARRDYETALSSVDIAEKRAALSKEALTLTEAAFNGGTGSSLEVTDAMQTTLQADVDLATKNLEAKTALLKLLYAVGKDMLAIGK